MNDQIRSQFPALSVKHGDRTVVYLDGPAGTQVPTSVIDAMNGYYSRSNANTHGHFEASRETDNVIDSTRAACAALVNAEGPECMSFGANMTSLAFKLSRAFARMFQPGDEVVITQLDHEANRGPWLTLEESGIIVHEINLLQNGRLDYDDARAKINNKTKLVAAGWASNILGTVNDMTLLSSLSKEVGALFLVDAVHYAPHYAMDVQSIGCDILMCSAYKFFGPHVGILYCKPGLLDSIPIDRLRTAPFEAPGRIETGTTNHAALAGTRAAIEFIASLGEGNSLRGQLESAYENIGKHERELAVRLWNGLNEIPGVVLHGTAFGSEERTPTIALTMKHKSAREISEYLGACGISSWDGHFYAIRTTEVLGLEESGGVVRLGIAAYTSEEEIDYTLSTLKQLAEES